MLEVTGMIGRHDDPEVQKTLDRALERIVAAGKTAGALYDNRNVEHYVSLGVRFLFTLVGEWSAAGAASFKENAHRVDGARTRRRPRALGLEPQCCRICGRIWSTGIW